LKGLDVTPQRTEGVATIHEETLRIDGVTLEFVGEPPRGPSDSN
jgi:hypothetical protein